MIGRRLGPYTVVDKLGEGAMGEVYAAEDTRLKRPGGDQGPARGRDGRRDEGTPAVGPGLVIVPNYLTVLHRLTGAK